MSKSTGANQKIIDPSYQRYRERLAAQRGSLDDLRAAVFFHLASPRNSKLTARIHMLDGVTSKHVKMCPSSESSVIFGKIFKALIFLGPSQRPDSHRHI